MVPFQRMSTYDTRQQKISGTNPRPTYLALGRDAEGREHCYRTATEEIIVIRDGQRTHIEDISDATVDQWMEFVASRISWSRIDYGVTASTIDRLATWRPWK